MMVDESTPISPAMLDPEALKMLFDIFDSPEFANEIINDFLIETAAMIADLETLAEQQNGPKLRYIAHSLKGSSLTYGATELANLCKTLEETTQLGQFDTIPQQIAQFKAEFLRVEAALRAAQEKALNSSD